MSTAGQTISESADDPLPVMQLTNWPLLQRPGVAIAVTVVIGIASTFTGVVSGQFWLGVAAAICFGITMWRMWIPVRFELDVRGVQQIILHRRQFIPWSAIARFERDANGVLLMGYADSAWWSVLQGLYISSGSRHQELLQLMERYVDGERQDESVTMEAFDEK